MRKAKIRSYRKMLRVLRKRVPPMVPVHTRRRPLKDDLGTCCAVWGEENALLRFEITINSSMSWDATWQVLIHEWGHALAWREGHERCDDHGPEWGLACALIYRECE